VVAFVGIHAAGKNTALTPGGTATGPIGSLVSSVTAPLHQQVTYRVESDAPLSTVAYYDAMNNMTSLQNLPASWSTSFTGKATIQLHSMSAQTTGEHVSCKIIVDGTVIAEQSATGRYSVSVCAG
jgi:hypothetical protein